MNIKIGNLYFVLAFLLQEDNIFSFCFLNQDLLYLLTHEYVYKNK